MPRELDVRLPWCGAFTTRSAAGSRIAATARSTPASMSPGRTTDTSPYRSSSTRESSLRTRGRSQSASGGCATSTRTPPMCSTSPLFNLRHAASAARAPARSAASGSNDGTGIPSHTSRGRRSRNTDPAPPIWSGWPWVIAR